MIREMVTKESAIRLDCLHSLQSFCAETSSHFDTFSNHLRKSYEVFNTHRTIPLLHHHLATVCSIMETQIDLFVDITKEIGI